MNNDRMVVNWEFINVLTWTEYNRDWYDKDWYDKYWYPRNWRL